jgi:hypothetical protein
MIHSGKFDLLEWLEIPQLWKYGITYTKKLFFNQLPEIPLVTFIPPFDMIIYADNKVTSYLVHIVQLWPYLKARISLLRTNPNVGILGCKAWYKILGKDYFFHQMRPKEKQKTKDKDSVFWKYGGPKVFGTVLSEDICAGQAILDLGVHQNLLHAH